MKPVCVLMFDDGDNRYVHSVWTNVDDMLAFAGREDIDPYYHVVWSVIPDAHLSGADTSTRMDDLAYVRQAVSTAR